MQFFLLFYSLSYGENVIRSNKLQTQYSIINKYNMNEHTLYSCLPSDPCEEVIKWKHIFTCIVGGPSGTGKTSFVIKLKTLCKVN